MDHAGNGILIERNRLNEVMELQTGHYTFDKFRYMCILSGCDYLSSLSGIGLAKANKVFKLARQSDLEQVSLWGLSSNPLPVNNATLSQTNFRLFQTESVCK